MTPFRDGPILGVGEAMVEFAPVGDGLYRRGFAGDTLNTCWALAQLLKGRARVGYVTHVGADAFSEPLVDFIRESGLDTSHVRRDPARALGLYVISLAGAERSFSYWRENSAARRLADEVEALHKAFAGAALIHVSGITLAVIGETGRKNLFAALAAAGRGGAKIAFDPNVRLRLWPDLATLRAATAEMLALTDIALPSFDDEAQVWGDADPQATLTRLAAAGVPEAVVKDGERPTWIEAEGRRRTHACAPVAALIDTTGAGDAFDAGYLAARYVGRDPDAACRIAQQIANETLQARGALAPAEALARHAAELARG